MNSKIHIDTITLPAESERQRQPLDLSKATLGSASEIKEWKVLSWVRSKPTWIVPELYQSLHSHPPFASSLLLLKSYTHDMTLAIYPISTLAVNHNLVIANGDVMSNARRVIPGKIEVVYVVWACTKGLAQRAVVKDVVEKAREVVGGKKKVDELSNFWDGLGVCTWESFGGSSRVPDRPNLDMLLSLVPSLPIKTFLIDDGWQDIVQRSCIPGEPGRGRLHSFGCWDGMGATMPEVITSLKSKGIQEVGVWLTLQGYWVSIDPESELVAKYDCKKFETAKRGQGRGGQDVLVPMCGTMGENNYQWIPSPEKAEQFWLDWFTDMKLWGVSFVKVDNQAFYDMIVGPDAAHYHQAMWSGMISAVVSVWGSLDHVIMCMSHNERMLNGPGALDFDRPSGNLIFRNSDDFNLPFEDSHTEFIRWNLYQSILTQYLSLVPDFDMFASNPAETWPTYHALLRSLCPGPMLLSDTPETESDLKLLGKLMGKTKDCSTKAITTNTPVYILPNRWFWDNLFTSDSGPALVASVTLPKAHGALMGSWNAHKAKSTAWAVDKLSIADVRDALAVEKLDGEWVIWSSGLSKMNYPKVGIVSEKHHESGDDGGLSFELETGECECWVVAKLWEGKEGRKVAVVGQMDKFATLAGVDSVAYNDDCLTVEVKYDSPITILYFGRRPQNLSIKVDDQPQSENVSAVTSSGGKVIGENMGGVWEVKVNVEVGKPCVKKGKGENWVVEIMMNDGGVGDDVDDKE